MPRPRYLGSSPSLNRSLSRLSSSSSFPSRHSNSRIYTFLVAAGLLLFAVVAFLQACLVGDPQGSMLSPLELTKSGAGVGAQQAWWKENFRAGNNAELDPGTENVGALEKGKLGRKMGVVQSVDDSEEGESGDEETEDGAEMGDEEDDDEDTGQDRFDIDVDDRIVEEEGDSDSAVAEMLDEFKIGKDEPESTKKFEDAVADSVISAVSPKGSKKLAFVKSLGSGRVISEKNTNLADEDRGESATHEPKQVNMAKVNGVPDWVLDGKLSGLQDRMAGTPQKGFGNVVGVSMEKRKSSFFWDHAVGVKKRFLENVVSSVATDAKNKSVIVKSGRILGDKHANAEDKDAAKVAVLQLRGFKEVVENWRERFNSDDELIDDNVQQRLEGVRVIEDALLLNEDAILEKPISSKNFDAHLRKGRSAFDPIDPVNNPMLQDPDTTPGTWMTKTDKDMLRAIRGDSFRDGLVPKVLLRGNLPATDILEDFEVGRRASAVEAFSDSMQEKEENTKSVLAVGSDLASQGNSMGVSGMGKFLELSSESNADEKQWGYYPGMRSLSFSKFMEAFLGQEGCSLNVFMAWTTPAWGFTARHQRVLESLFRFHRDACVVVFSDTFELNFFSTFLEEGYKVAVVRPNAQELFAATPYLTFTSVLPRWKENPFFHLHFTKLMRMAALYKFGGVYLDMDVLVMRPLDSLHNTVGSEIISTGELRLNGAILVFEKSSLFLKKCMEEFTNTYDETLPQFNGADLLTRVANSAFDKKGSTWNQFPDLLNIQDPFTFFPLTSSGISKYFDAPKDDIQKEQQRELLTRIFEEAVTVHLWNSITSDLVPDVNSVVGIILSRSCLRCNNVLR